MNSDPVDLRRVHWFEGLFLRPEHFRRVDGFAESLALWNARYGSALFGLVGPGPRPPNDPSDAFSAGRIRMLPQNGGLAASVERVRGLTPAGAWIDVPTVLHGAIPTLEPESQELLYVVRRRAGGAFATKAIDGQAAGTDEIELADAEYLLTTRPQADDGPWSIVVGRVRRSGDVSEPDTRFIPACAFVSSHVELSEKAGALHARVVVLETMYVAVHERLREITTLARRAGILISDHYEEMLRAAGDLSAALGDCAFAVDDRTIPVRDFVGAFGLLASRAERTLRMAPSLVDYLRRAELALQWRDIKMRTAAPLRGDENLADRVEAAEALCQALEDVRLRLDHRCEDYRLNSLPGELELAVDRQTAPKQLFERVADPVGVEAVSRSDIRFRFTGLRHLDPELSYIAILFGAGTEPLAAVQYMASVVVNDKEQQHDITPPARRIAGQRNLAVPVDAQGEHLRDVTIRVPGGGPFGTAALYRKVSETTTESFRQRQVEVPIVEAPEFVTINLTGYKSDREKSVDLRGSNQVRVRMLHNRPPEKGGTGTRRMLEVVMTKRGTIWSLNLAERDKKDPRFVWRWGESSVLTGLQTSVDQPDLPKFVQIGISDPAKGPTWFLKCRFKYMRADPARKVEEAVAARLEDVSNAWPLA